MELLALVLCILAAVLFGIAAFNVPARINLVAAGLCALTVGAFILPSL